MSEYWGVWLLAAVIVALVILGLLFSAGMTPPGAEPY